MEAATLTRTAHTAEDEIRALIDRWTAATKSQDLKTVLDC